MNKNRYLWQAIKEDITEKMVFIGGPRQVGKTTLAKQIALEYNKGYYYNWDKISERKQALAGLWPSDAELILLDEFHKYSKWKTWIKGEYDSRAKGLNFLLTGSARLNIYRRGGDSLQGRYHYYTLFPFSGNELTNTIPSINIGKELNFGSPITKEIVSDLYRYGGFPEPLLKGEERTLRRWHHERIERFFREDIRDLTKISDFGSLSLLADMINDRTSSILSINSLATDLQVNFRTLSRWLDVFELFYYCFRIPSYQSKRIASVRKEKKLYLWDWSQINEEGARYENFLAVNLLKFCTYLSEREGWNAELFYLRDTNGREVDFLITIDRKPWFAVEAKISDDALPKNMVYFKERMQIPFYYVVVKNGKKDYIKDGIRVLPPEIFLSALV